MKEKRYIEANALIEKLKQQYGEDLGWQSPVNLSDIAKLIEGEATADVAEVVRCCKCKYYDIGNYGICRHPDGLYMPKENDSCACGKRKE